MPAYVLTIGGSVRSTLLGTRSLSMVLNGVQTLECDVLSEDGSYIPAIGNEVIFSEDGTAIFGGVVEKTRVRGTTDGGSDAITTNFVAHDFAVYMKRRKVSGVYPEQTLEARLLEWETDYFGTFGIAVDAAQPTGKLLPETTYDNMRLDQALSDLDPEWVWKITPLKKLIYQSPTAVPAPYDIVPGIKTHVGDITVERSAIQAVNRVIVKGGEGFRVFTDDRYDGDGVTRDFPLRGPLDHSNGTVYVDRGGVVTDETWIVVPGSQWTYDPVTWTISQKVTEPILGVGEFFLTNYRAFYDGSYAVFPWQFIVEDLVDQGLVGIYEERIVRPDVFEREALIALGEQALRPSSSSPRTIQHRTHEPGLLPGHLQHVEDVRRDLDDDVLITEVRMFDLDLPTLMERTIIGTTRGTFDGSFRDTYKEWWDGGSSAPVVGPTTEAPGGAPGGDDTEVQFNDAGEFGGDSGFTYDKTDKIVTIDGVNGGLIARGTLGGTAYGASATGAAVVVQAAINKTIQAWKALTAAASEAMTLQQNSSAEMFLDADSSLYISAGGFFNVTSGNDLTLSTAILKSIKLRPGAPWNPSTSLWTTSYGELRDLWAIFGLVLSASRLTASHTIDSDIAGGALMRSSFAFRITSAAACTLPPLSRSTVIAGGRYRLLFISNIDVSTADVTVTPDGSDLINGAATLVLKPGQSVILSAVGGGATAAWMVIASAGGVLTKLDDLDTPDDNTDLNVSTSRHGLTPKLPNDVTKYLDGTGAFSTPSAVAGGGGSVSAIDVECLRRAQQGLAVYSGCTPTEDAGGASMDVDVTAGHIRLTTAVGVLVTAGAVTLATADVTNPRIDLVWVNTSGTLGKTDGTAAVTPEPPSLPANSILLATVSVPANDTTITNAQITDKRTYTKLPQIIKKTADESVTSSSALQDDDHLKFTIGASEAWVTRALLFYRGGTTGDFKTGLTAPAGATKEWSSGGNSASVTGNSGNWTAYSGGTDSFSGQSLGAMGTGGSNDTVSYLDGHVLNSTTPGTVQVQWAQATSNGTATSVLAGSYIMAWPQF